MKKRVKTSKIASKIEKNGVPFRPIGVLANKKVFLFRNADGNTEKLEPYFYDSLSKFMNSNQVTDIDELEDIKQDMKLEYNKQVTDIMNEFKNNSDFISKEQTDKELSLLKGKYMKKLNNISKKDKYYVYRLRKDFDDTIYEFTKFLMRFINDLDMDIIFKKNGNLNKYGNELFLWYAILYENETDQQIIFDDIKEITELSYGIFS